MVEIWKDIPEYEGLYQVSNFGNIKSLKRTIMCRCKNQYKEFSLEYTREEKIIKGRKDKDGYLLVNLCKNGKHKNHRIHRLVAQAFIINPNNYKEINHKNENKQDNNIYNLEWCDSKYNSNYGTRIERIKEIKKWNKMEKYLKN